MYKKRYLRTFSVGFIPFKSEPIEEDDDKDKKGMFNSRRYTSQELLEISGCPVPSNVEALAERGMGVVMAKSFGLSKPEPENETIPDFDFKSRLIHHEQSPFENEEGDIIPEKVIACMAIVLGARGGIEISDRTIKRAMYNHFSDHYKKLGKMAPEFKDYTESELREMFDDVWFEELGDIITLEMKRKDEEREAKSGRVLSEKNRSLVKKCADMLMELYNASEPSSDDGKTVFDCECIKCGHKMKSEKHCNDIKCPKCGGQMRRAERPGPGREVTEEDNEALDSIGNELAEIEKQIKG